MFQIREVSDRGKVRPDSPEPSHPDPYLEKLHRHVAVAHAARAHHLREMILRIGSGIRRLRGFRSGPASKATSWGYSGR